MNEHDANAEINAVAYRDILLNMNLVLTMVAAIFALLISIKTTLEAALAKPPGNLSVSIVWPVGNSDVDLWVLGPGEPRAIGYSRKSGKLFDLLRDDLGLVPDATGANFETSFTRGVVPGEYTINVHAYRCPTLPLVVNVEVAISGSDSAPMRVLVTTSVTLTKQGQEATAIRFYLEKDGTIRKDSMHRVFKPIRSAKP
jgi:hypothetical protein